MKNIFIPYEIAKQLNETGFDEPCMGYYAMVDEYNKEIKLFIEVDYCPSTNIINISDDCYFYNYNTTDCISAPTWEQVFKWFRERGYLFVIGYDFSDKKYNYKIVVIKKHNEISRITSENYPTYEQARENLALELIELYKNETTTN